MTDRLFMEIPSRLKYLRLASNFGLNAARSMFEGEDSDQNHFTESMELALNEAVTNSIRHRNPDSPEASVVVEISLSPREITIRVKDTNSPFDSEMVPTPDLDSHPENGYGIYMIKEIMDKVETSREKGWNILTMSKKLGGKQ